MKSILFWKRSNVADQPVETQPAPHRALIDSLRLVVLTTFAVTQPIYDRLGDRPAFVVESGVEPPAILVLAAALSLVIPVMMALVVCAAGRLAPRAYDSLYSVAVYVLLVIIILPVVKRLEFLPGWTTVGLALALGGAGAWLYFTFRQARAVVTAAAPAIVVFPALFLFHSPISSLFSNPLEIRTARWKPVPVVMIVLDELRGLTLVNDRNEIDAERFPNFAELARGSAWFRNATTVYPDTWQSVPAILSGKYPSTRWPPSSSDRPQNLFSVIESTGDFELAVFEPVSRLAPLAAESEINLKRPALNQAASLVPALARVYLAHLTPGDYLRYLPEIPRLWFGLHDSRTIDRARRRGVFRYSWGDDRRRQFEHFLDCLDDSPKPALYFLHVLLPHVPWCYLPSGRRYLEESNQWELLNFDVHNASGDFWGTDELYVMQSQQRQMLQLGYADYLLGQLLARLRESALYDKCLLIVTADHGICFRVGEARRGVTPGNLAEIMSIPLFLKMPGQQSGSVSDRNVESIDIFPTIADVLGIELKLPIDGRSILDPTIPERTEKILHTEAERMSVSASIVSDSPVRNELRSRFGSARDPEAPYRIGPHPELLGRSVESLPLDAGQPCELELTRSGTFYSTDSTAIVPCYVEGRVVSPAKFDQPVRLAVAVNGTIRAVTRTYLLDGLRNYWTAMVPESAYREGENDLQYFVITGQSPDLRLTSCVTRPAKAN